MNKSDLPAARPLVRDLKAMLRFRDHPAWLPPVVETVSTTGHGINELVEQISRHGEFLDESGEAMRQSERRTLEVIRGTARRDLETRLDRVLHEPAGVAALADVMERRVTPREAATQMIERLRCGAHSDSDAEDGL